MELKSKAWKIGAAVTVSIFALDPELIGLALIIDAMGLDLFLLLLEIQTVTLISVYLNSSLKRVFNKAKVTLQPLYSVLNSRRLTKHSNHHILATPGEMTLMHGLAISAFVGIVTASLN